MEIGLDYMQMRASAQYYGLRWAGIGLLIGGVLLVLVGLAYYGNIYWLRANVGDYAAQRPGLERLDADSVAQPSNGSLVSPLVLPAESYSATAQRLGFTPLSQADAKPLGTLTPAERLIVPELGINVKPAETGLSGQALVMQASVEDIERYASIQANPGERGAMWFFGEVGSGARSFGGLRNAPEILAAGEDVMVFVDSGPQVYLYAATHTDVMPIEELRLSSIDRATIHLVVPVPSGLFDHFLVMTGELVGVK